MRYLALLAGGAIFLALLRPGSPSAETAVDPTVTADPGIVRAALSAGGFVPNLGQWEHDADFVFRNAGLDLWISERQWTIKLLGPTPAEDENDLEALRPRRRFPAPGPQGTTGLRFTFVGASATARVAGEDPLRRRDNYFLGNDPARWRTDVPRYRSVACSGLYPGIDLRLREVDGNPEYDLMLAPGASLDRVSIRVEGAGGMHVDADGGLWIDTVFGPLVQPPPLTWQTAADGTRHELACRYVLVDAEHYAFAADGWNDELPLTIDPGLVYSTYVGSNGSDDPSSLHVAPDGLITLAGTARGPGISLVNSFGPYVGSEDVAILQIDPSDLANQVIYSTYLGGTDSDFCMGMSMSDSGVITVTGASRSTNFPQPIGAPTPYSTAPVFDRDAFVAQIDPAASGTAQLRYVSFVGGSGADWGRGVGVDAKGMISLAGDTNSADLPTTPDAFDPSSAGDNIFVARFDPTQTGSKQLVYLTYAGGSSLDVVNDVAVEPDGTISIVGITESTDLPTTDGSISRRFAGGADDGYLLRFDPSARLGEHLIYGAFIGGRGKDEAWGIDVHASGVLAIAGWSWSSDFPITPNALDPSMDGFSDAFVWLLSPYPIGPSQLLYSSYYGGSGHDSAADVVVHDNLTLTFCGKSRSVDFPTTFDVVQSQLSGSGPTPPNDIWVVRVDGTQPFASQLMYATLLGGDSTDNAFRVGVDRAGNGVVLGEARSGNFPVTPGVIGGTKSGTTDMTLSVFSMQPESVDTFGRGTPGCEGDHSILTVGSPQIGNPDFSIVMAGAPARSTGLLLVSGGALTTPLPLLGTEVWLDIVNSPGVVIGLQADQFGTSRVPTPIPNFPWLVGSSVFLQAFWINPAGQPPCPLTRLSATAGLQVRIQS